MAVAAAGAGAVIALGACVALWISLRRVRGAQQVLLPDGASAGLVDRQATPAARPGPPGAGARRPPEPGRAPGRGDRAQPAHLAALPGHGALRRLPRHGRQPVLVDRADRRQPDAAPSSPRCTPATTPACTSRSWSEGAPGQRLSPEEERAVALALGARRARRGPARRARSPPARAGDRGPRRPPSPDRRVPGRAARPPRPSPPREGRLPRAARHLLRGGAAATCSAPTPGSRRSPTRPSSTASAAVREGEVPAGPGADREHDRGLGQPDPRPARRRRRRRGSAAEVVLPVRHHLIAAGADRARRDRRGCSRTRTPRPSARPYLRAHAPRRRDRGDQLDRRRRAHGRRAARPGPSARRSGRCGPPTSTAAR